MFKFSKKLTLKFFLFLLAFVAFFNSSFSQSVIYVNLKATGKKDGTSWTDAFVKLEDAFSASQIGDSIFVAKGTYKPAGTSVNSTFTLPAGRSLFGGFVGTENSVKERKAGTNLSYLDGDLGTVGVASDNCRFVITMNNVTSAVLLDGFSIVNGYAYNTSGGTTYGGGGLRITNSKLNLKNCRIHDNYTGMRGGAIYAQSSSIINITDCAIYNNSTGDDGNSFGGAMFINDGTLTIKNSKINDNYAYNSGAIFLGKAKLIMDRTVISGNTSKSGNTTMYVSDDGQIEIYNSLFVGSSNTVTMGSINNIYSHKIINCTFIDNLYGIVVNSKTEISNCIFWNRDTMQIHRNQFVKPKVSNCIVKGGFSLGKNIVSKEPIFINSGKKLTIPFNGDTLDYSLLSNSSGINQGNDSFINSNYNLDLYGNSRSQGGMTDLGAIESPYINYLINVKLSHIGAANIVGDGSYSKDSTAKIRLTGRKACYTFLYWKENDTIISYDTSLQFKVTKNRNLVAHYSLKQYSVGLSSNPVSGGQTLGSGKYNCSDSSRTFTAKADSCFTFVNWTLNGAEISKSAVYSSLLNNDLNLVANFKNKTNMVSTISSPFGAGSISGSGNYACNDSLRTFNAIPTDCYDFVNWTIGTKVVSAQTTYITKVNSNLTLTGNFKKKTYSIQLSSNPTNGGSVSGFGQHACDATITVTAIPNTNYKFDNWKYNGSMVSSNPSYTFTVKTALNLEANFKFTGNLANIQENNQSVFPNPGNGDFTIKLDNLSNIDISIYDMQGKLVYEKYLIPVIQNEVQVQLNTFQKGLYFVRIKSSMFETYIKYSKVD